MEETSRIEEIQEIYNQQPEVPIMGPQKQRPVRKVLKIIALVLLVISLVGWLSYFIIKNVEAEPTGSLSFTIEAPDRSAPGVELSYVAHINNDDTRAVENVRVRLNYPDGFVYRNADPEPEEGPNNTWQFDRIDAGQKIDIQVTGALLGDTGAPRVVFGAINYYLEGFRSPLEQTDSVTTFLGDEIVSVSISVSGNKPNESSDVFIDIANNGDDYLQDLNLKLNIPEGVKIIVSNPEGQEDNAELIWQIGRLNRGDKLNYAATIEWPENYSDSYIIDAELQGKSLAGLDYVLASDKTEIKFEKPLTAVTVLANGSELVPQVKAGSNVALTFKVKNVFDKVIHVNQLTASFPDGLVDWDKANLGLATRNGNNLNWSAVNYSGLANIQTGEEQTFTWILPVSVNATTGSFEINSEISGSTSATGVPFEINVVE